MIAMHLRLRMTLVVVLLICAASAGGAVRVDSIGSTSLDAQNYGPTWQRIYNLPGTGIYVTWVKDGMFYNFLDYGSGNWLGEIGVFPERDRSGNLDVDVAAGSPHHRSPFISTRTGDPAIGIETSPGSGVFEYRSTAPTLEDHYYPPIALTANSNIHLLCYDPGSRDTLLYSRSTDHGTTWSAPVSVCGSLLPGGTNHNIVASENSNKVAAVWSHEDSVALWVNRSADNGSTWTGPQNLLPLPSAIPGARPGNLGAYGVYDAGGRLNLVTQVWDGTNQFPAEIWHYQEGRSPVWTRVCRYAPGQVTQQAEPGEPFVCRPSIGCDADGDLFVAWMNYDSLNYDPGTQIARADLFVAQSATNGLSWSRPFRVTGPDSTSRISPCLASNVNDTLVLVCIEDKKAGVYERGHGPQTTNRVTVLRVPTTDLPGIEESPTGTDPGSGTFIITPVPAADLALIHAPSSGLGTKLAVWNEQGRLVDEITVNRAVTRWSTAHLIPGVYFVGTRPGTNSGPPAVKLVVSR